MREDLLFLIGELDRFYVEWQSKNIKKKIDAELGSAKAKAGPTKGRR